MEIPRPQKFQATALLPYIIHFPQINRRLFDRHGTLQGVDDLHLSGFPRMKLNMDEP